jgi:hypothetical protein
MNSVTLYRIGHGDARRIYVTDAYRAMTSKQIVVPKDYALRGPCMKDEFQAWFASDVAPVMKNHCLDLVVYRWSLSRSNDPYMITVSMCINNDLVIPDILGTTMYWSNSTQEHERMSHDIRRAIQEYMGVRITLPSVDLK